MRRLALSSLSLLLLVAAAPASAGLFNDEEARLQIQQMDARLAEAEASLTKLNDAYKKQTSALLDLQMSIDTLNTELRKLRGQNEELLHNQQETEKRVQDFYVDLDGRLHRFEAVDTAAATKANNPQAKTDDPATENRALEAAFNFYKTEHFQNAVDAFQDFLSNYPKSAHAANIRYWLGNSYFILKDYKNSLANYQLLVQKYDSHPKVAEALLSIADCQELLGNTDGEKSALKQVIGKFPNTEAARTAKKRLAALKK